MNLPKAAPCAGSSFLVVAGRTLYAVKSSRNEVMLPGDSFQYDAEQNMRKELSPMMEPHGTAPLVLYLDGYIYVFGYSTHIGLPERCNVAEQKWEILPDFHQSLHFCCSAITYEGSILVYDGGKRFGNQTHNIHQYNPSTNA